MDGSSRQEWAPPEVQWLPQGSHRWGDLDILEVRGIALTMLSTSSDPLCAMNASSWGTEDGASFIDDPPQTPTGQPWSSDPFFAPFESYEVNPPLRYPLGNAGFLAEGVLFTPNEMEDKWAIFFYRNRIIFIRSWLRSVVAVADTRVNSDGFLEITHMHGGFSFEESQPPEYSKIFNIRCADFLLRALVLRETSPAPITHKWAHDHRDDPRKAAYWCFSLYGRAALVATPVPPIPTTEKEGQQPPPLLPPQIPPPSNKLYCNSLLHISVARGDVEAVARLLADGVPANLHGQDGFSQIHWALETPDVDKFKAIVDLLLQHGGQIDFRARNEDTPLMSVTQKEDHGDEEEAEGIREKMAYLLSKGADPNAHNSKGFTPLHRAAEVGNTELVRLLLAAGAKADPDAMGYTPLKLAQMQHRTEIIELIEAALGLKKEE